MTTDPLALIGPLLVAIGAVVGWVIPTRREHNDENA